MIFPAVTALIINDIINIHLCYAEQPGTPPIIILSLYTMLYLLQAPCVVCTKLLMVVTNIVNTCSILRECSEYLFNA